MNNPELNDRSKIVFNNKVNLNVTIVANNNIDFYAFTDISVGGSSEASMNQSSVTNFVCIGEAECKANITGLTVGKDIRVTGSIDINNLTGQVMNLGNV